MRGTMLWQCPACQTVITHGSHEDRPRLDSIYRCHVCRLELTLDASTNKLMLAPLTTVDSSARILWG